VGTNPNADAGLDLPVITREMLDEGKAKERLRSNAVVQVTFQDNTITTTSSQGAAPLWKQSLTTPLKAPDDDFSPSNLEQIEDEIHFTLFDELLSDDSNLGGFLEGESTERIDRRYLGSFRLILKPVYTAIADVFLLILDCRFQRYIESNVSRDSFV
jgi:hypothetical protein